MKKVVLLFAAVTLFAGQTAAGDYERGKALFEECAVCHGEMAEGGEDFGAPRLAGQYAWYLITQLQNFRAGVRGTHEDDANGQVMQPMAESLDDLDIEDLVTYISTL